MSEVVDALAPVARSLERLNITWCLGGSVASSIYGQPRSTMDVDLVADMNDGHVTEFAQPLTNDFYVSEPMIRSAIRRRSCFNLIHLPTSYKVDIFVLKDREFDRKSMKRIRRDRIGDDGASLDVWVASPEDVMLNKLEWYEKGNRTSDRQWTDIGAMIRGQPKLEFDYLRHWAAELNLTELLDACLSEFADDGAADSVCH